MNQCTKGISNSSMGQRDQGLGENILRWEKTGWGSGDNGSWGVDFI
jgi:hypothetical protein